MVSAPARRELVRHMVCHGLSERRSLRVIGMNEHWFTSLQHARVVVESWRREYNEERPKKSLGGLTPAAYAKTLMKIQLN